MVHHTLIESTMDDAIENDQGEIITSLIDQPEISKEDLGKALVYFAKAGEVSNFEKCLQLGADINYSHLQETALTGAIENQQREIIDKILNSSLSIDINFPNFMNETPLILSIKYNDKLTFNALLKFSAELNLYHQSFVYGTALTAAIFFKHFDMAEQLIQLEKSFNIHKHPGAFQWAVSHGSTTLVERLYNLAQQQGKEENKFDINSTSEEGLEEAPDWAFTETLGEKTAFTFNPTESILEPPLVIAMLHKNEQMVKLLLQYKPDLNSTGRRGLSPEKLASFPDMPENIRQAIQNYKANQQAQDAALNSFGLFKMEASNGSKSSNTETVPQIDLESLLNLIELKLAPLEENDKQNVKIQLAHLLLHPHGLDNKCN